MFALEFADRLNSSVVVYRTTTTLPDAKTGAADLVRLKVLESGCYLSQPSRDTGEGDLTVTAGVPMRPPAYRCYLPYASLPRVPVEALEVWVNGLRYPLLQPPLDPGTEQDHLKLLLGPPQEGALDTHTVRRGTVVFEVPPNTTPLALPGSAGLAYALITPTGGNASALEYTLSGTAWQSVAAMLELTGVDVQSVRLRTQALEPVAVRVDYY